MQLVQVAVGPTGAPRRASWQDQHGSKPTREGVVAQRGGGATPADGVGRTGWRGGAWMKMRKGIREKDHGVELDAEIHGTEICGAESLPRHHHIRVHTCIQTAPRRVCLAQEAMTPR